MVGLCEGGNEPSGSLKAICRLSEMSGNFESQMPRHPDNMNNNGSAINFLHFNHAFKKVNSFFGNVDPKTPVQFYKYHLYDLLKPLWLELRVLGVLPLEKTTEHGSTVFRRTCAAMLYSVTFYVVVGIYIVYIGMVKVKELQALKPNQFDEVVHFFQITHNVMPLKEGSKNVKVMAVLVPVLSIVAIIADWSMMPEFKVWEICGYSYTTTLVHLHVVLWYCTCCSVAACGRHLVHLLYQGTQNGRHVSNYCSLWQDLSRLSRKIGESFCYIYGLIIIIWFSTMTLSLYGGLTGILDHGCGLREFGLIVNATFCTFILFLICDAGEKLSDEVNSISTLSLKRTLGYPFKQFPSTTYFSQDILTGPTCSKYSHCNVMNTNYSGTVGPEIPRKPEISECSSEQRRQTREQRSWIKIEVTRGRSAQECFQALHEACADRALSYRTVARWVKAFWENRDAVQDNLRTGRPRLEDNTVQLLASLLDADRRWTAHELAADVTKLCSTFCKTFWVTAKLQGVGYPMKFPKFNNGIAMQSHRPCWTGTKGKMTTFLDESSLWTKPGLAHTNQPNLKRQSN
ncbi:hypothetical protein ANN_25220 [Periplaneta americana]|uniref:Gustatory receptor n=1 Tax=Periplaneta americana TaxID=6978 RepID=A0ABQ8S0R5_PERAM|nr:hypothetical protein ANN_25220 [Periplaneta americana]